MAAIKKEGSAVPGQESAVHTEPYKLEKQVLHLPVSNFLEEKMKAGKRGLYSLTDEILKEHRERYSEPLQISRKSLSCEIRCHYFVYRLSLRLPKRLQNTRLVKRAIRSTKVIDCGSKEEDTNRWIWDFLSVFTREPKS